MAAELTMTVAAATGGVILAHGAMGPWDDIAVGVPLPVLFAVLVLIGRRSKRVVFEEDDDLEYSGADSFERGAGGVGGDAAADESAGDPVESATP